MTQDNPYKLTKDENRRFFEEHIKARLEAQTKAVDTPHFVLIGGQSGAGKSHLTSTVITDLKKNAVVLDADNFRPMHPSYKRMVKANPSGTFEAARDDVNAWLKQAAEWARTNKRNVIMDGTLREKGHISNEIKAYKNDGYKIELNLIATHERFSHTSIFERYEGGIKSTGIGRYVDPAFHKAAYDAIPGTVKDIEDNKRVERIRVWNRNYQLIYDNRLDKGQWEKKPEGLKIFQDERDRPPTLDEIRRLQASRTNTLSMMSARNAPADEIRRVEKEFASHSLAVAGIVDGKLMETREAQIGVAYKGEITAVTDTHYFQSVQKDGHTISYMHDKKSFAGAKELKVGDYVSIKHISPKTALAVQKSPLQIKGPASGLDFGKK